MAKKNNIGIITQITGAVVDVSFEKELLNSIIVIPVVFGTLIISSP